jgi:hypothetical protein
MPKNSAKAARAFQELVRVLEEALLAGAQSVGLEYEDRDLVVYLKFGNTGVGSSSIPPELQQGVITEIVKRAGLSRKCRGKMQVCLLGKDYEVAVEQYDTFGDPAFTLTPKEPKKARG